MSSTAIAEVQRDFYRFCDAADALSVSHVTLWRWVRDGKVEAHRIGREVLLERRVIDSLKPPRVL